MVDLCQHKLGFCFCSGGGGLKRRFTFFFFSFSEDLPVEVVPGIGAEVDVSYEEDTVNVITEGLDQDVGQSGDHTYHTAGTATTSVLATQVPPTD